MCGGFNLVLTGVRLQATQQIYQEKKDLLLVVCNSNKFILMAIFINAHLNIPFPELPAAV